MRKVLMVIIAAVAIVGVGVIGYALGNSNDDPTGKTEEETVPWTGPTSSGDTAPVTGEAPVTGTTGPASDVSASDRFEGLNLTAYTPGGYGTMDAREDLQRLKNIGSTSVTLVPTWYMTSISANRIKPDGKKTPTDASLGKAISWARENGLKVVVKPHVDLADESFRGEIQPANRARWFESYRDFIGHYAGLAAKNGADLFSVGTELKAISGHTDPWKKVIELVRSKFGGQLTYAANWDEVDQVRFWDSLDLIGVDAYYPLAGVGQAPTEADLVAAWQTPMSNLAATSAKWGKPVIFTEIGYPSQAGAAAHPYEVREGDPPDQKAQAVAYRAAFRAFAGKPWFKGMSWWSWRADPGPHENLKIDFTPEGKKAEDVLVGRLTG